MSSDYLKTLIVLQLLLRPHVLRFFPLTSIDYLHPFLISAVLCVRFNALSQVYLNLFKFIISYKNIILIHPFFI
jgi:hypothetical protein